MTFRYRLLLCWLLSLPILVLGQSIPTIDADYDPKLKTVLLYPMVGNSPGDPALTLNPPVLNQQDDTQLMLEFDDLTANYRSFRAKLIHCNADWQKSVLNDIEFTFDYNDYPITEYQTSINTKIPFYHYRFPVPKVKLPGNYVLVVYNERGGQTLFTRRFMMYAGRVGVAANVQFSTDPQLRFSDQQVDFDLDYRGYPNVISPQDDFNVVVRQNYRDDRVLTGLKPTNVRAFESRIEYRLFDLKNTFPGGNEYRFFDTRTVISSANYIARIDRRPDVNVAWVMADEPRSRGAYLQNDDFNGRFVIDNMETREGAIQGDYIATVFTLRVDEIPNAEVFVNGAFNLWQLNPVNRMTYSPQDRAYRAEILLKQGVYNYNYSVKGVAPPVVRSGMTSEGNEALIEGNFSGTENDYEIFVYHRPPAARADQLIGYKRLSVNRRR